MLMAIPVVGHAMRFDGAAEASIGRTRASLAGAGGRRAIARDIVLTGWFGAVSSPEAIDTGAVLLACTGRGNSRQPIIRIPRRFVYTTLMRAYEFSNLSGCSPARIARSGADWRNGRVA